MTRTEINNLKKEYTIYSVSTWENINGHWCKISFAPIYDKTTVGTERRITTEWLGCRWESLENYLNQ